ncbi:MAG: site-specific DNA-methyltransferase [Proteobacteria bacterium]|nr:MAG: site-specific DNA-methyltransferase [Pseudomonadota bacterium]
MNHLFYGDNLHILRQYGVTESVDLIYLDPPFNSARDYNVIFREKSGVDSPAQMKAFSDSWSWTESAFHDFIENCPNSALIELMRGFVNTLGRNDLTAYLVMMSSRIVELHRVLKSTGSLYLHCDPTASHYLKIVLDAIFGPANFRNEIIWKRTSAHNDSKQGRKELGQIHDVILFYSKSLNRVWNPQFTPYDPSYLETAYKNTDPDGRRWKSSDLTGPGGAAKGNPSYEFLGVTRYWRYTRDNMEKLLQEGRIHQSRPGSVPRMKHYLDEMPGIVLQDVWDDIAPLSGQALERLGYPTQKPISLLERIINASSHPGDVVLDPFCGCGTATVAAQKMGRQWIGIDITHLAISLIKYRFTDMFALQEKVDYDVIGVPTTAAEARALALQDRDSFQQFAIGLVPRAIPAQSKKGADRGIDGILYFRDDPRVEAKKGMIQVKSGAVSVPYIRDFGHVMTREKATLGLFLSLESATKPMVQEAGQVGFYTTPLGDRKIPRLQIRTVGDLLEGRPFDVPQSAVFEGIKVAQAHSTQSSQGSLGF